MYNCEYCRDNGGISINSEGFSDSAECSYCGRISTKEYIDKINKKLEERNEGVNFYRTKSPYGDIELAFHEMWAKLNRRSHFNGGYTYLQLLMSPKLSSQIDHISFANLPNDEIVTERDYKVAATVIQWLGSNIGQFHLKEVMEKIEKDK